MIRVTNGTETAYQLVPFNVSGGTNGTQPTFSGPVFSSSYIQIGRLVHFEHIVDFDNITSFGTGQYYMTLPFKSARAIVFREGCLHQASSGKEFHISAHVNAGDDKIWLLSSDKVASRVEDVPFTSTYPFTLNTADNFHIAGTYIIDVD